MIFQVKKEMSLTIRTNEKKKQININTLRKNKKIKIKN